MIHFRFLRIERRLTGVRRIGIRESHRAIRRFDIGATDTETPRGLTASLTAELGITSRRCRKDGLTPGAASLVDVEDESRSRSKRHVAWSSWRRRSSWIKRRVASTGGSDASS